MATQSTQHFVAYFGIDWGATRHDVRLQADVKDKVEFGYILHWVECIDEWARAMHQRFGASITVTRSGLHRSERRAPACNRWRV